MYCIYFADFPITLSIYTCNFTTWDTQLFLFRGDGAGVATNNDVCAAQSSLGGLAHQCQHTGPGNYFIAISRFNKDPLAGGGQPIFPTEYGCAADGDPIVSWGTSTSTAGAYTIILVGDVFYCGGSTRSSRAPGVESRVSTGSPTAIIELGPRIARGPDRLGIADADGLPEFLLGGVEGVPARAGLGCRFGEGVPRALPSYFPPWKAELSALRPLLSIRSVSRFRAVVLGWLGARRSTAWKSGSARSGRPRR